MAHNKPTTAQIAISGSANLDSVINTSSEYYGGINTSANVVFSSNIKDTPIVTISADTTYADNAAGKVILVDSSSARTVTVAAAATSGFAITIVRKGTGNVTIANTTGVTRLNTALYSTLNISNRYETATVIYTATNEIILTGSIT